MGAITSVCNWNGFDPSKKEQKKRKIPVLYTLVVGLAIYLWIESAQAVEIEPMGKALATLLGSTHVVKKKLEVEGKSETFFYTKSESGKVGRVALVEDGLWESKCTHTWAIGLDGTTGKVLEVRVLEMGCPHAMPTRSSSFLDQFKGKGPADAAQLESKVDTIAKATGSCKLAAKAVSRAIIAYSKAGAQL